MKAINLKGNTDISCPISAERIDEHVARAAAFYTIAIMLISLAFNSFVISALLGMDFALRAFTSGNFSIVKLLSKQTIQTLNIPKKPVNLAPKKFAAGLGMAFCFLISGFQFLNLTAAVWATGATLLFCAVLEGGFAICLGCLVYTYAVQPFIGRR